MLNTLLVNLNHAVWNRETTTIGGGVYSPEELEQAVNEIKALRDVNSELLEALKQSITRPGDVNRDHSISGEVAALRRLAAINGIAEAVIAKAQGLNL